MSFGLEIDDLHLANISSSTTIFKRAPKCYSISSQMDRWKGVCNVNKCNMLQPCKFDQYSLETGETDIQNVARNVFNKVLVLHF